MSIKLIDKIEPKNNAFTGLVDAKQIIGGADNKIPIEAIPDGIGGSGTSGVVQASNIVGDHLNNVLSTDTLPTNLWDYQNGKIRSDSLPSSLWNDSTRAQNPNTINTASLPMWELSVLADRVIAQTSPTDPIRKLDARIIPDINIKANKIQGTWSAGGTLGIDSIPSEIWSLSTGKITKSSIPADTSIYADAISSDVGTRKLSIDILPTQIWNTDTNPSNGKRIPTSALNTLIWDESNLKIKTAVLPADTMQVLAKNVIAGQSNVLPNAAIPSALWGSDGLVPRSALPESTIRVRPSNVIPIGAGDTFSVNALPSALWDGSRIQAAVLPSALWDSTNHIQTSALPTGLWDNTNSKINSSALPSALWSADSVSSNGNRVPTSALSSTIWDTVSSKIPRTALPESTIQINASNILYGAGNKIPAAAILGDVNYSTANFTLNSVAHIDFLDNSYTPVVLDYYGNRVISQLTPEQIDELYHNVKIGCLDQNDYFTLRGLSAATYVFENFKYNKYLPTLNKNPLYHYQSISIPCSRLNYSYGFIAEVDFFFQNTGGYINPARIYLEIGADNSVEGSGGGIHLRFFEDVSTVDGVTTYPNYLYVDVGGRNIHTYYIGGGAELITKLIDSKWNNIKFYVRTDTTKRNCYVVLNEKVLTSFDYDFSQIQLTNLGSFIFKDEIQTHIDNTNFANSSQHTMMILRLTLSNLLSYDDEVWKNSPNPFSSSHSLTSTSFSERNFLSLTGYSIKLAKDAFIIANEANLSVSGICNPIASYRIKSGNILNKFYDYRDSNMADFDGSFQKMVPDASPDVQTISWHSDTLHNNRKHFRLTSGLWMLVANFPRQSDPVTYLWARVIGTVSDSKNFFLDSTVDSTSIDYRETDYIYTFISYPSTAGRNSSTTAIYDNFDNIIEYRTVQTSNSASSNTAYISIPEGNYQDVTVLRVYFLSDTVPYGDIVLQFIRLRGPLTKNIVFIRPTKPL